MEHNPDEPLAYYNLISVYDKCKMFDQAEEARKRLKERFSKKPKDESANPNSLVGRGALCLAVLDSQS